MTTPTATPRDQPVSGPYEVVQVVKGYEVHWKIVDLQGIEIGRDGGEPEDQLLIRDWGWVCPALNAAYAAGLKAGAEGLILTLKRLSVLNFTAGNVERKNCNITVPAALWAEIESAAKAAGGAK